MFSAPRGAGSVRGLSAQGRMLCPGWPAPEAGWGGSVPSESPQPRGLRRPVLAPVLCRCPYLHRTSGDTERRYHLRYYKTGTCIHETDARGHCAKNGPHCAFAHGPLDLRPPVCDIRCVRRLSSLPGLALGPATRCPSFRRGCPWELAGPSRREAARASPTPMQL